jgi:hypothetical protein
MDTRAGNVSGTSYPDSLSQVQFFRELAVMPKPIEPGPPADILSSIVVCAECGHTMSVEYVQTDGKEEKAVFGCGQCGHEETVSRILGYNDD